MFLGPRDRKSLDDEELLNDDDEFEELDDYETRRQRALDAGWDEAEMSLEEFEDYFM